MNTQEQQTQNHPDWRPADHVITNAITEVLSDAESPREIATHLDDVIFDWMDKCLRAGEGNDTWMARRIYTIKSLRDAFMALAAETPACNKPTTTQDDAK